MRSAKSSSVEIIIEIRTVKVGLDMPAEWTFLDAETKFRVVLQIAASTGDRKSSKKMKKLKSHSSQSNFSDNFRGI